MTWAAVSLPLPVRLSQTSSLGLMTAQGVHPLGRDIDLSLGAGGADEEKVLSLYELLFDLRSVTQIALP